MTEYRRCISLGRGPSKNPHFYFGDCDRKDIDLERLKSGVPLALIVESNRGYHVLNPKPITDPYALSIVDPLCPGNAVRVYPHDDLKLIRPAGNLCVKVAHIYEAMFPFQTVTMEYLPCTEKLKPGIYMASKDGVKLLGAERHG